MKRQPFITTSWDDGHPLDLRVADLLETYGLKGTFYVPRQWQRPTMDGTQLRALALRGFELGGHTIDHVVLTKTTNSKAHEQITQSRDWLSDISGDACKMFCPPTGRFNQAHVEMIEDAGYLGFRTVEFWSLGIPRPRRKCLLEMPTSVQSHPQPEVNTLRNIVKRRSVSNLWRYIRFGGRGDWTQQLERCAKHTISHGGVIHLWGHSWELEETQQWGRLEKAFSYLRELKSQARVATNSEICQHYTHPS